MQSSHSNQTPRVRAALAGCAALAVLAACDSNKSATDLIGVGPPMVRQVRFIEDFQDTVGGTFFDRAVFGFGTYPGLTADAEHHVTSAAATGNSFRIIMDELLQGNYLQQISCRGAIDSEGDTFGSVPSGATPDDIVKCCAAQDVLPVTCVGPLAVCVGPDPLHPVGVLDANQDGAADAQRFLPGAVELHCTDATHTINVPIDLDNSYWNPSGDQQVPAEGGLGALGPAIVLVPAGAMPTNTTCGLVFSGTVIDKSNESVCIPPNGLPVGIADDSGNLGVGCTPTGTAQDFAAFSFKVEALRVTDASPPDKATGVSTIDPASITFVAPINPSTIGGITITQNGVPVAGVTETLGQNNTRLTFTYGAMLTPNTTYVITVPTSVTDAFGEALPTATTITFTTGS